MPGLKFSWIHANEPLINKRSEWLSSPAGGKEKVDPIAVQHCVMGSWVPARYWEQRCSSPRIRDAPTLRAEISQHRDQGCPSPGSRDVPALRLRMLQPWDQSCPSTGIRDAACDGQPKPGHQAQDARQQPGDSTSSTAGGRASDLDPNHPSPHFTHPQIPVAQTPKGRLAPSTLNPSCPFRVKGRDGAKPAHRAPPLPQPPPGAHTHLFNHCVPNFNIISCQPASQRQLLQITINGSLFSQLLLNRYRN